MKFSVAMIALLAVHMSFAGPRTSAPSFEAIEPSPEEFTQDLVEAAAMNGEESPVDRARINWNPANSAGKLVIKVRIALPQQLEVFRQNSANPADLTPLKIFKGGTSSTAAVSTAWSGFACRGGRPCSTPRGNFNIDSMELMHYSSRFNNSPMPHSMFFMGSVGIAIHGIPKSEWKDLGKPASHGCVRIHPDNATILYTLLQKEGGTRSGAVVQIN